MKELRRTHPTTWVFADKIIPLLISRSEATRAIGMEMAEIPERILVRASETRGMLEQFDWDLSEVERSEICHAIATDDEYDAIFVAGIYRKYTCIICSDYSLKY